MARRPAKKKAAPRYKMKDERDVYITMRDGVRVAVRIYRPDAPGEFPTLFAASPYMYDTDDLPHSTLFLWREIGPVKWYVENQGYAYVHLDLRGSGKSEGTYRMLSKDEQDDLYEVIEWIARQPWSNGNVGGIGQSYYCWTQWFMGIVSPPHLKCIAPYDGSIDIYRDATYHGGVYGDFIGLFHQIVRVNNLHKPASQPGGKLLDDDVGLDIARRQTYDAWWRERSAFERIDEIKVPTYSIGHWGKLGLHLRGNILAYETMKCPKKLDVTGAPGVFGAHDLFEQIDYHEQNLLPFYDKYLKGVNNGWEKRAPVRLYVTGANEWRDEREFPLKRAKYVPFHLSARKSGSVTSLNDGSLTEAAPSRSGGETAFRYPDPQWKVGTAAFGPQGPDVVSRVLTFTSAPLAADLEVIGPIVLELYASSSNTDTDFFARLTDQAPQDPEARKKGLQPAGATVSKGWLRASHREKDEKRSTSYRPFYTHTNPQPLTPAEIYKFEIEVMPIAHRFKKGHRIRLELANADSPVTENIFSHQYVPWKVGRDTFHHSAKYPSRLLLPVVRK